MFDISGLKQDGSHDTRDIKIQTRSFYPNAACNYSVDSEGNSVHYYTEVVILEEATKQRN